MNTTLFMTLAFAIGIIAGLRSLTAPMVVAWAARFKWIDLDGTWASFLGGVIAPWVFTALAVAELVSDQLPKTPSRTSPAPFAFRVVSGAFSGAALATGIDEVPWLGAIAGGLGAVAGTLGGHAARVGLVKRLRVPDFAVAIPEDFVAVVGGFLLLAVFFR
jgi:uncharacterized membrane protein